MNILSKWLFKKGITNPEELLPEEKVIYDKYRVILSGENISVDKIKEFCEYQVKIIENKFADNPKTDDDTYLKACLHIYLNILKCIEAPEKEREALEKHLTGLL